MSPPPRFYLHIGTAKSGTTFLQETLFGSRQALADHGVAMVPPRPGGHLNLALQVAGMVRPQDAPEIHQARERFSRRLREASPRVGIFSHELIAPAPVSSIRELVELLEGYEVHVVVTVRDPGRTLASAWQQSIQQRQTVTLEEFLTGLRSDGPAAWWFRSGLSLPTVVGRWAQVVPWERIHVVVVPPSGSSPDLLLRRFCAVVGLDAERLSVTTRHGNPALGNVQAELLRRVNVALGDRLPHARDGYRQVGKQWLAMQVLRRQVTDRPRLPERARTEVESIAEEWIAFLREHPLDVVGDVEELRPDDRVFAADDTMRIEDSVLLDAAAAALADIVQLRHEERATARVPSPVTPARGVPGRGARWRAAAGRHAPGWVRRAVRWARARRGTRSVNDR